MLFLHTKLINKLVNIALNYHIFYELKCLKSIKLDHKFLNDFLNTYFLKFSCSWSKSIKKTNSYWKNTFFYNPVMVC